MVSIPNQSSWEVLKSYVEYDQRRTKHVVKPMLGSWLNPYEWITYSSEQKLGGPKGKLDYGSYQHYMGGKILPRPSSRICEK